MDINSIPPTIQIIDEDQLDDLAIKHYNLQWRQLNTLQRQFINDWLWLTIGGDTPPRTT